MTIRALQASSPRSSLLNRSVALVLALTCVFAACTTGLGGFEPESPPALETTEAALGIDLGLTPTAAIEDDFAVVGARIPLVDGSFREIALLALVTETPADDADGAGTPLVRDAAAPADDNNDRDVFLVAFDEGMVEVEGTGRHPTAFSRALVNVFRHDRCVTCHAAGSTTPPGEEEAFPIAHPGPATPILENGCTTCHSPSLVADLEDVVWEAPLEADGDFDFRGLSVEELNERAQVLAHDEHLLLDDKIIWAITSGNVPFEASVEGGNAGTSPQYDGTDRDRGAVPISFETWSAQVAAWAAGGFQATAAASVKDVVLVSQAQGVAETGDGASFAPSLTWIPDSGFDPAVGGRAGQVLIAYASYADDLTGEPSPARDVFITTVNLFIDQDPADGGPSPGDINLALDAGTPTELVSVATTGGGANGDSDTPSIDGSGGLIAFSSSATNLVAGFSEAFEGTSSHVYLRDTDETQTLLVDAVPGTTTQGGDGPAHSPSLSRSGSVVVFASTATNLVAGDSNGAQDIFYCSLSDGALTEVARASVSSSGTEGSGGDCRAPEVAEQADRVSIVFESDKTDLAGSVSAATNVFLFEDGETTLLSQRQNGASSTAGNGVSRSPRISPTATSVVFETEADNLDSQDEDLNGVGDIMLVDLGSLRAFGSINGRRLSVDTLGKEAEGASRAPTLASFIGPDGSAVGPGFTLFRSAAQNLGEGGSTDLVSIFVSEGEAAVTTDFEADVLAGPAPLTVQFTDLSTGNPTAWAWDFGDGSGSTLQNPSHEYSAPGAYTVSVVVSRDGGDDVVEKIGYIRALTPLTADFSGSSTSGPVPHTVTFTPSLGGDTDGVSYSWTFGDGTTSTEETPTHAYADVGTYTVSLAVSGLAGDASETKLDYIDALEASGANFTFDQSGGLRVAFVNQSEGSPTSFSWDFDGRGTSTLENPTFDFPDNGTYSVTLDVDGPGGPSTITIDVPTTAPGFESIIPRFSSCDSASCHGVSTGNLFLSDQPANATTVYDNLVGQSTSGAHCTGGVEIRVIPFDSTDSWLARVADPADVVCTNGAGSMTMSAAALAELEAWIDQGAARSDAP